MNWRARRARRHAARIREARRQGYSQGVLAAVDALMCDLEKLGVLDDAEVVERGDDGAAMVCPSCAFRGLSYHVLADRREFAIDLGDGQAAP